MIKKDIVVDIPNGSRIQNEYVYHVVSSTSRNRGDRWISTENRVCIGKRYSKDKMNPNEKYFSLFPSSEEPKPNPYSDCLKVGSTVVLKAIIKELGIDKILEEIFTSESISFIMDVILYFLVGQTGVMQHFSAFMRDRLTWSNRIPFDTEVSELFKETVTESTIEEFQRKWVSINNAKDAIAIGYDSTNYNSALSDSIFAEYGKAKDDEGLPQVNLSYVVDMDTGLPLFYERYYGSINDISEFKMMVKKAKAFNMKNINIIMDRGYYGAPNLSFCDKNGYGFIILAKSNGVLLKKLVEQNREELRDNQEYYIPSFGVEGMSVKAPIFQDNKDRYIHIYYNSEEAENERMSQKKAIAALQAELEDKKKSKAEVKSLNRYSSYFDVVLTKDNTIKSYSLRHDAIKESKDSVGFFCIITSKKMSAEKALANYRSRNNLEIMFKQLKTYMGLDKARVHSDKASEGKYAIAFIASILRSYFERKCKELIKTTSSDSVLTLFNELDKITCTLTQNGESYVRKYALTAKQKEILKQFNLNEKDIDKEIKNMAPKFKSVTN